MFARYANGRAAVLQDATYEIGADALTVHVGDATHVWSYTELARTDDGNGRIALKRKPDTGERLYIDHNAATVLERAAPKLFKPHAQGVERPIVVWSVLAGAWSLAAAFLVGVPMMADPIARVMPPNYRHQIADISWGTINQWTEYCDDSDEAALILNNLAQDMMEAANVERREDIWITIVNTDQIRDPFPNALALPDDSIIVTDDLIALAEHPDELIGVLAHEIAHIEHNHVMKGIVKQIGAGIFFDVVFGGAGAGQAIAIASVNLAGLRYTRGDEEDADARGLDILDAAGVNPGGLARLFARFAELQQEQAGEIPTMLSTHPASEARARLAQARAREGLPPSLNAADWAVVRQACAGGVAPTPAPAQQAPADTAPQAPQTPAPFEGPPEAIGPPKPAATDPDKAP